MAEPFYAASQLWFHRPVEFPTVDGGKLVVAADNFINYEFTFALLHVGEEADTLCSLTRLTDADGTIWEGESVWTPSDFLDQAGRFGSLEGVATEVEGDVEIADAFRNRLLLDGVKDLRDDRFYRRFLIGLDVWEIRMKYQSPVLALAAVPSLGKYDVYARISSLRGRRLLSQAGAGKATETTVKPKEEDGDEGTIPPFIFKAEIARGLFLNLNAEEDEGIWTSTTIPELVRFTRTGLMGAPQPLVQYVM